MDVFLHQMHPFYYLRPLTWRLHLHSQIQWNSFSKVMSLEKKKKKVNLALVNEICNFLAKIYLSKFNQEQGDYQWSGMKTSITDKIKLLYIEYKYIDNDFIIEIH